MTRRHIARQICLAAVAGMATHEGLNGKIALTYLLAALLLGGVNAKEIREPLFGS